MKTIPEVTRDSSFRFSNSTRELNSSENSLLIKFGSLGRKSALIHNKRERNVHDPIP